ncbi:MAG: polymer-forming cytoskeletal protein [Paracoccaceae bacterium]
MEKTTISADLRITGNLSGKAEIDVTGSIDGDVEGKSIDILTGGSVSGAVKVSTAHIRGRLAGSLEAETVELHSGADVKADIITRDLEVQNGAKIVGKLDVSSTE